jgi:hypothetical protein
MRAGGRQSGYATPGAVRRGGRPYEENSKEPARRQRYKKQAAIADSLANDAGEGAGGCGVELFLDAAGEEGFAAGLYGVAHGFGH